MFKRITTTVVALAKRNPFRFSFPFPFSPRKINQMKKTSVKKLISFNYSQVNESTCWFFMKKAFPSHSPKFF